MNRTQLLVIPNPDPAPLTMLHEIEGDVVIVIGDSPEFLAEHAEQADVILNAAFAGAPFRMAWPLARKVRWIHSLPAGVENFMTPEFAASAVPLTNGRGVFKRSLAEFALGAIFHFTKDYRRLMRNQEAGRWEPFDTPFVEGQTLGIVGYGEIGQEAAKLARAVGMKVLALRRRPELSNEKAYAPGQLKEMLARCDYVLAATPLTPQTRGMIGENELRAMKPSAVIMNVGRGPVIAEAALIRALREGWIRGAALDVFDHEPLPEGHPFYGRANVLLSPHCADHTPGWIMLAMAKFIENFKRFQKGEELLNIVDKGAGY